MTLFGSKNKHGNHHDAALDNRHQTATGHHATSGAHHEMPPSGYGSGVGAPMGSTTAGMTQTYPGPNNTSSLTGGHGVTDANTHEPYTAGTTGYNTASGPGGAGNIPHSNTVNHGPHGSGTNAPTGTKLTGKMESALGSMVGSSALKAKGLEKEREANTVKLQSQELSEAERLEKEALLRRERAVGHGAHPANSHLGAGGLGGGMGGGRNDQY